MAYKDLHEFIAVLEKRGELKRIKAAVNPELEITEIANRVLKQNGPALLFEKVEGSEYPVLINVFGSKKRMSLALDVGQPEDIAASILELFHMRTYSGLINKMKFLPKLAQMSKIVPRRVSNAPCQEVVSFDPDLTKLPILKCWPKDGGRFITLPLVVTRNPFTGKLNLGMYRMQVYDSKTTGMHWHVHKDGQADLQAAVRAQRDSGSSGKMPVSVALGADPATIYAATAPLPQEISEYLFAGLLRQKGIEVVKCITNDLEVPAHAEFVLEGYVDFNERRIEGPFGDHTGYYSLPAEYPVFHVKCITHRRNPIYPTIVVGRPPMEDCYLAKATERIFLPILKLQLPELVDINFPPEGGFHNCAIVSIRKRYPGHAKKVMHAIWGLGQMMFTKLIIVVDEDVSPQDLSAVMWRVFHNTDAKRDVVMAEGPVDALDHASALPYYGWKMGIDATRKWKEEGYSRQWPEDVVMSPEVKALVDEKWKTYGLE